MADETGPDAHWRAAIAGGTFLIQRCADCARHVFQPRRLCPHCSGTRLDWVRPSGLGVVHATTVVARPADRGGPYNVALVELDEAVRMMSRVEGVAPEDVRIGMRVRAEPGRGGGGEPCVLFRPVAADA